MLGEADRRRLARARWERLTEREGVERLDLGVPAWVQPLPWDSEMFGRDCRQLHLFPGPGDRYPDDLEARVSPAMANGGWDHLFTRIDAADARSLAALQGAGFDVIESLVTFVLPVRDEDGEAETLSAADAPEVAELAGAFSDGRYLVDPAIPKDQGLAAYRTWAANAAAGRVGDVALGLREAGALAGFVTLALDREAERTVGARLASVGLIAVRPASQGRGVGRALMGAALAWGARQGCVALSVGTQTSNVAAQRLYTGVGFRPSLCEVSLRRIRATEG